MQQTLYDKARLLPKGIDRFRIVPVKVPAELSMLSMELDNNSNIYVQE